MTEPARFPIRWLGEGYEAVVDEDETGLTYCIPVDSGFVSTLFKFPITADALEVLQTDPYRRAALEIVAHTLLQRSMGRGQSKVTPAEFTELLRSVLFSRSGDLKGLLRRMDRDHNIVTAIYIQHCLERWQPTSVE